MKSAGILLALAIAATATGLQAQQTPQPARPAQPAPAMGMGMGMSGGMGMDVGMMQAMMAPHGPQDVLALRDALALTEAQLQQLRALASQTAAAVRPHHQAAMAAHHAALQALEGDNPDLTRYEAQLKEAATHAVEGQVALARAFSQALALLTPEQRSNVRFAMRLQHTRAMQGMMGGMSGGMMGGMSGGMMGGMTGGMTGGMSGQPGMQGMQHDMGGMQHDMSGMKPDTTKKPTTTHH